MSAAGQTKKPPLQADLSGPTNGIKPGNGRLQNNKRPHRYSLTCPEMSCSEAGPVCNHQLTNIASFVIMHHMT